MSGPCCGCGRTLDAEAHCPACQAVSSIPGVTDAPSAPPFALAEPDLRKPPWQPSCTLLISLAAVMLALVYFFGVVPAREGATRMAEHSRLFGISTALHYFLDKHARLPMSVGTRGSDGKPLLSWRVLLLPYIEQEALYRKFKLDEPWDGPNNLPLLAQMPKAFRRADDPDDDSGLTHYLAVTGPGCAFDEAYPRAEDNLTERGTIRLGKPLNALNSSYVSLVTAAKPVPWTKPEDFEAFKGDIPSRLDTRFGPWTFVVMADGHVARMRHTPAAQIRDAFRGESDPPQ